LNAFENIWKIENKVPCSTGSTGQSTHPLLAPHQHQITAVACRSVPCAPGRYSTPSSPSPSTAYKIPTPSSFLCFSAIGEIHCRWFFSPPRSHRSSLPRPPELRHQVHLCRQPLPVSPAPPAACGGLSSPPPRRQPPCRPSRLPCRIFFSNHFLNSFKCQK
jgi:hypothetical protein